jgi:hypothetical protein
VPVAVAVIAIAAGKLPAGSILKGRPAWLVAVLIGVSDGEEPAA